MLTHPYTSLDAYWVCQSPVPRCVVAYWVLTHPTASDALNSAIPP